MEALLTSTLLVAVAEIGDKTQLLSFVLAARLRKPGPIIAGIFAATILNHAAAAWAGSLLGGLIPQSILIWVVGLSFIGFGLWALHPDALGDSPRLHKAGVFVTAFVAQWSMGAIIDLFPRTATGGFPPEAYTAAFGTFLAAEIAGLLFYLPVHRRLRAHKKA